MSATTGLSHDDDVGPRTRELDEQWISAIATVEQPNRVLLTVRFDRRNARLGDPGSYTGTISIVDPRVSRVDQQFTVQLAYPWWQFVAAQLALRIPRFALTLNASSHKNCVEPL